MLDYYLEVLLGCYQNDSQKSQLLLKLAKFLLQN